MMKICNKFEFTIILVLIVSLVTLIALNKVNQDLFADLFYVIIGYAIKGRVEKVKVGGNNG